MEDFNSSNIKEESIEIDDKLDIKVEAEEDEGYALLNSFQQIVENEAGPHYRQSGSLSLVETLCSDWLR